MRKASAEQLQELDRIAIEDFNIDSLSLMERAGCSVAQVAVETLKQIQEKKVHPQAKTFGVGVNVICGKGNNGGDGFVCARYLISKGIKINVFLLGEIGKLKNDALHNYNLLKERQDVKEILNLSDFGGYKDILGDCDLIIDAIFGIGLKGRVKEPFESVIKILNNTKKTIISVDVPSGLNATTGEVLGECTKATKTVTFSLAKTGFFINQGPEHCGEITIVDIGIPEELIDKYLK